MCLKYSYGMSTRGIPVQYDTYIMQHDVLPIPGYEPRFGRRVLVEGTASTHVRTDPSRITSSQRSSSSTKPGGSGNQTENKGLYASTGT